MTVLACAVTVQQGGTTAVTLSWEMQRSGSTNDRASFRIVRRADGVADVVLPSAPQFSLGGDRDVRSWTWIDVNVPTSGVYSYVLQIMKLGGGGTFYAMSLIGVHYRR